MKLHKLITTENVHLGLGAKDAEDALGVVAERVAADAGLDAERVREALLERERLGSTSVGDGFAIPHCKLGGLDEIVLALCRFNGGIDLGAADGKPVEVLFVVLSPPDQPAAHLQVLSQIARLLKRAELRSALTGAGDAEELVAVLARFGEAEGL